MGEKECYAGGRAININFRQEALKRKMERPPHAELAKIHLVAKWLPVLAIFPALLLIVFDKEKDP